MGYILEATIPAVLLLAPDGLNVTLQPGKSQDNLWMLIAPRACNNHPPPLPQDPLTGKSTTCWRWGPQALATPWPILQLLAQHQHTRMAHATPEQHRWLHTHFEPAPADVLATVAWTPDTTAERCIHRGMFHSKHPAISTRWWQSTAGQHQKPPGTPYPGWRAVPKKQTIKWTTSHPKRAYLLQYIHNYLAEGHERNNDYVQTNAAAAEIINQGIAVYATPKIKPATTTPWTTATMGVCIHAYQPTTPCRLPCPDNQNTVIFAHASGTIGHTLAAGGAALELRPDTTGQLRQHHLTATTIFRASLHGDLKKPAMIVDSVCPAC